ncbi:hypothetical protein HDV05_008468 [Chytridiales sp. JEL 0842]|nr:hypothetical protein HDV05_008468 [Chytridiales sp. JEL 0842]
MLKSLSFPSSWLSSSPTQKPPTTPSSPSHEQAIAMALNNDLIISTLISFLPTSTARCLSRLNKNWYTAVNRSLPFVELNISNPKLTDTEGITVRMKAVDSSIDSDGKRIWHLAPMPLKEHSMGYEKLKAFRIWECTQLALINPRLRRAEAMYPVTYNFCFDWQRPFCSGARRELSNTTTTKITHPTSSPTTNATLNAAHIQQDSIQWDEYLIYFQPLGSIDDERSHNSLFRIRSMWVTDSLLEFIQKASKRVMSTMETRRASLQNPPEWVSCVPVKCIWPLRRIQKIFNPASWTPESHQQGQQPDQQQHHNVPAGSLLQAEIASTEIIFKSVIMHSWPGVRSVFFDQLRRPDLFMRAMALNPLQNVNKALLDVVHTILAPIDERVKEAVKWKTAGVGLGYMDEFDNDLMSDPENDHGFLSNHIDGYDDTDIDTPSSSSSSSSTYTHNASKRSRNHFSASILRLKHRIVREFLRLPLSTWVLQGFPGPDFLDLDSFPLPHLQSTLQTDEEPESFRPRPDLEAVYTYLVFLKDFLTHDVRGSARRSMSIFANSNNNNNYAGGVSLSKACGADDLLDSYVCKRDCWMCAWKQARLFPLRLEYYLGEEDLRSAGVVGGQGMMGGIGEEMREARAVMGEYGGGCEVM